MAYYHDTVVSNSCQCNTVTTVQKEIKSSVSLATGNLLIPFCLPLKIYLFLSILHSGKHMIRK